MVRRQIETSDKRIVQRHLNNRPAENLGADWLSVDDFMSRLKRSFLSRLCTIAGIGCGDFDFLARNANNPFGFATWRCEFSALERFFGGANDVDPALRWLEKNARRVRLDNWSAGPQEREHPTMLGQKYRAID